MRLIDVDALGIGKAKREIFDVPEYADGWNSAIDAIDNAPTIEAEPVRHGEWKEIEDLCGDSRWQCSVCDIEWCFFDGTPYDNRANYCPNCGAKMDGKEKK